MRQGFLRYYLTGKDWNLIMKLISVDKEKCTRCGRCADVCPTRIIDVDGEGPHTTAINCIACGHCVAVCPTAALDNSKAPLAGQEPSGQLPVLDADTAVRFLRARRSVRSYKKDPVSHEKILQLLDIARLAPTGSNSQGVVYHVIDNPDTLHKITEVTIEWMEELVKNGSPMGPYLAGSIEIYRQKGQDAILRGAPCLILAAAPKCAGMRGRDNTHFCLAYAELYAPALDLGTCWTGLLEGCAGSGYQPLLDLLNLPDGLAMTGGLMVGYPRYLYKRFTDRNQLHVTWG